MHCVTLGEGPGYSPVDPSTNWNTLGAGAVGKESHQRTGRGFLRTGFPKASGPDYFLYSGLPKILLRVPQIS